jgi:hypothetical protein
VIRFSAALVVVAVGVLIGGIATSLLALVYVAIGLSVAALIALAIGVALKRDELFGVTGQPSGDVMGAAAGQPAPTGRQGGYPPVGQERAGQAFTDQPAPGPLGGNVTVHGATGGRPAGMSRPASGPASPAWGTGTPARGPVPSAPPAEEAAAHAAPPTGAPVGPSQAGVTETRADLTAISADTPQTTDKKSASDPAETRLDVRAEAGQAAPGKAGSGSEETRLDLPPVRPGAPAAPAASGPERPNAAAPDAGTPGVTETRLDMSPVLADEPVLPLARSEGTRTSAPPAGADDTRLDLPAQPPAPSQPGASAQPGTPAQPASPAGPTPQGTAAAGDSQVAVIPGVPRYHAPNCILIRFMDEEDLEKMTMDQAKAAGFTPCTACQADSSFKAAD